MEHEPIFKFRDNETEADYKIFENGKVHKQTDKYGKFNGVGLVINRIPQLRQTIAQLISELTRTHPFDRCVTAFGRTQTEIARALDYWDNRNKEIKMTREEAKNKAYGALGGEKMTSVDINVRQLLNILEALGLIKFEEKSSNYINIPHCGGINEVSATIAIGDAIACLTAIGYEVKKK